MITRKIGKLLRGKATPFQIVAACVLGALLGFAPAPLQAPALYVLLVAVLLVVNANLGVALLVAAALRVASWFAAPVSFEIGRFLLDGPTQGLAERIVNAPVLAWCGLQYYAVAGGQLLGLVLGLGLGLGIARGVGAFRRRMARAAQAAEAGEPSRLRELVARPWARATIWLLFGGADKTSWEAKLGKRVGNPVRIWGAALLVVLLVAGWVAQRALAGTLAQRGLRTGLERVNGATVDVGPVVLELNEGRLAVSDLALADPNALAENLFAAAHLEADVDQADFLRRRLHVGRIVVSGAHAGQARAQPGTRTRPPEPVEEEPGAAPSKPGDRTLEDVLAEVEVWKERLAQARVWLDRLAPLRPDPDDESFTERAARRAREMGWLRVQADHLLDEAPTFRLSELVVEEFEARWLPGRTFDLRGSELSTQPWLLDAPPKLSLASRDGTISFEVDLSPASRAGGSGALKMTWKGLSLDDALAQLKLPGPAPFRGGTIDLALDGAWADGEIGRLDLPLRVVVRDTIFAMEGIEPTPLEELVLPIGLFGPIDALRVRFDGSALTTALVEAGKKELANQVKARFAGELGARLEDLGEKAGVKLPGGLGEADPMKDIGKDVEKGAKDLLEGVLGGKKKDDAKKKDEDGG